ncbi:hypothetical protein VNI00_004495 [Paramarasmius palmivorus]|uniref:Uncharacterized protein n=1 Tax=Paramarasmius palmivorus TaxID=297713 RepID=A0AAW0DFE1_9AGAR
MIIASLQHSQKTETSVMRSLCDSALEIDEHVKVIAPEGGNKEHLWTLSERVSEVVYLVERTFTKTKARNSADAVQGVMWDIQLEERTKDLLELLGEIRVFIQAQRNRSFIARFILKVFPFLAWHEYRKLQRYNNIKLYQAIKSLHPPAAPAIFQGFAGIVAVKETRTPRLFPVEDNTGLNINDFLNKWIEGDNDRGV